MLALTLNQGRLALNADYPQPAPGPGEALLKIRQAGICGTDLALLSGYKDFSGVPGHEYVAEVVAAPGNESWVGRRVVGEINTVCGTCDHCQRGLRTHCENRRVLGIINWDGAFAQYLVSPVYLLHQVPDEVPDDCAVFTEPLAAAYSALRDAPEGVGDRVIIFGDGRLGQLIALVFKREGYDPLLVGHHPEKLALAAQAGVRTALQAPAGQEFDIAVEVTGRATVLQEIFGVLRPRGALILKTTSNRSTATLNLDSIVVNEWRLIGSRCGPFDQALQAMASGRIDPRPLISARYPLSQALEAFEKARQRSSLKVLLSP